MPVIEKRTNLPAVQSLWVGSDLSPVEQICIKSFLRMGHPFHLYTYGRLKGVPEGTTVKEASAIAPAWKVEKFQRLANFSDYFRYCLLYKHGGWWVDLDVFALWPFDFSEPYVFAEQRTNKVFEEHVEIINGIVKVPAASELMRACIERISEMDTMRIAYDETGPPLFNREIYRLGLAGYRKPYTMFLPLPWYDSPDNVFGPESGKQCVGDALSIHFFGEQIRRGGIDKFGSYPGSLFDHLRRSVE